jgi:hypothetical protein
MAFMVAIDLDVDKLLFQPIGVPNGRVSTREKEDSVQILRQSTQGFIYLFETKRM